MSTVHTGTCDDHCLCFAVDKICDCKYCKHVRAKVDMLIVDERQLRPDNIGDTDRWEDIRDVYPYGPDYC